jgi:molybdopterin molybdotransferase
LLNLTEALEAVLSHIGVLDVEEKALLRCAGRVSAENIRSEYNLPMLPAARLDGYAVRTEDIAGAGQESPVTLRIIGTARAGVRPKQHVKPGTAMRIMTGSVLPPGADGVVRFEDTDEPGDKNGPNAGSPSQVKIFVSAESGANISPAGSMVKRGALVLPQGKSIGPAQISALAAIGKARVRVVRRPRVAIIATGDELISLQKAISPGKTYNSNAAAISALVTHYGGLPLVLGIARDNEASLLAKIRRAVTADAVITSGGVSMGDYDLVRLVIAKLGNVVFSRLNMGPGRSFTFGLIDRPPGGGQSTPLPVFGLSGPPAGCLNNFETLVRPALLKMMGFTALVHPAVAAVAGDAAGVKPLDFVKWSRLARVDGEYRVLLNGPDKAGMLAQMAAANSLTIVPAGAEVHPGDSIEVWPLDWSRD